MNSAFPKWAFFSDALQHGALPHFGCETVYFAHTHPAARNPVRQDACGKEYANSALSRGNARRTGAHLSPTPIMPSHFAASAARSLAGLHFDFRAKPRGGSCKAPAPHAETAADG